MSIKVVNRLSRILNPCYRGNLPVRWSSSAAAAKKKKFYVTTPIFYINSAPHIGHLYTMILADTFKRYHALLGQDTFLLSGTDEHGIKVLQAAKRAGMNVEDYCDQASVVFSQLASQANVSLDKFIRTTEYEHISAVVDLWTDLEEKGFIYKGHHQGWYCDSDETFYPEAQVQAGSPGEDGVQHHYSIETGKPVHWTSEVNYFFALSEFRDKLLHHLHKHPNCIYPKARYNEVLAQVTAGLEDLSVSRSRDRYEWGIPVPNDDKNDQIMYVWLDALTNYISAIGYPWKSKELMLESGWPADVHVIGKDIVRFHCIYWPAFLMAAELPLPKQVVVHSHWTLQGKKMSKSVGNVVDPFLVLDRLGGPDPLRLTFLRDGSLSNDNNYSTSHVTERWNSDVVGKIGNLCARVCSPSFNARRAVESYFGDENNNNNVQYESPELVSEIDSLSERIEKSMKQFNTVRCLTDISLLMGLANKYMTDCAIWTLTKSNPQAVDLVLFNLLESLRVSGILLQPFLPTTAKALLDRLAVDKSARTIDRARFGSDKNYAIGVARKGDYIASII